MPTYCHRKEFPLKTLRTSLLYSYRLHSWDGQCSLTNRSEPDHQDVLIHTRIASLEFAVLNAISQKFQGKKWFSLVTKQKTQLIEFNEYLHLIKTHIDKLNKNVYYIVVGEDVLVFGVQAF